MSNYMNLRDASERLMLLREDMDNGGCPLPESMRETVVGDVEYRQGRLHALLCLADLRQGDSNVLRNLPVEHVKPEIEGAVNAAAAARGLADAYANDPDWSHCDAMGWYTA